MPQRQFAKGYQHEQPQLYSCLYSYLYSIIFIPIFHYIHTYSANTPVVFHSIIVSASLSCDWHLGTLTFPTQDPVDPDRPGGLFKSPLKYMVYLLRGFPHSKKKSGILHMFFSIMKPKYTYFTQEIPLVLVCFTLW